MNEEMSEDERISFEKEMEMDDELKKDFYLFKATKSEVLGLADIHEAINDPNFEDALSLANETVSEYFEEKNKSLLANSENTDDSNKKKLSGSGIKRLYHLLLPLAAVLITGLFIKVVFLKPNADDLYTKYYGPAETGYSKLRGDLSSNNSIYALSNLFYMEKDYRKADSVLNLSGKNVMESPDYFFFNGLIKMGLGSFEEASSSFENYLDLYNKMQLESEWYLSLCYLKLDNVEQSEQILNKLNTYQNTYQTSADNLLREIRRLRE